MSAQENDVPVDVMRILIERQIELHKNSAAEQILLARINRKVGSDPTIVNRYTDEAIRFEKLVAALKEELQSVTKHQSAPHMPSP